MFKLPSPGAGAVCMLLAFAATSADAARAQTAAKANPETTLHTSAVYGPYNGIFLADGLGISHPLHAAEPLARAGGGWSMSLWESEAEPTTGTVLLAGLGSPAGSFPRFLGLDGGRPFFWAGGSSRLTGSTALKPGTWHSVAISVEADGNAHLYADGAEVAHGRLALGPSEDVFTLAPAQTMAQRAASSAHLQHFAGRLALVRLDAAPMPPEQAKAMRQAPPSLDLLTYAEGSPAWPVQTHGTPGMLAPQDPSLLPHSAAPPQKPVAVPLLRGDDAIAPGAASLLLRHHWQMVERSTVAADGSAISRDGFDSRPWMAATVPGTVLTTLIDRGVYPDPDFGLNNSAIPESLSRQSFWYRTSFSVPASMRGRRLSLTFHGINYRAHIWMNGTELGEIVGAFQHRTFDVTAVAAESGNNVLAVRIDPPPHGGIAHEQSLAAGAGDNGGVMMLDGPTFGATEGWDWMPGIRDRNMGIWQDVELRANGEVTVESPAIITTLPLPDTSRADVTVRVPLHNGSKAAVEGDLLLSFDGVSVRKHVTAAPGDTEVELRPAEFPQLTVQHPRLWWPNGYGRPELYTAHLEFSEAGTASDTRDVRFGIRQMSYELSLMDPSGHLRRVEVAPAVAALEGRQVVNQTHEGFRETPDGWVASLLPGAESSAAVKPVSDLRTAPALVIRVNGVRIAARGGSWGMDDIRKRVSRERMEPFFRLHREANVNIIRNWMGQNTEEVFYDLADEYGMLVWNDFWDSTQDWNLEPMDPALFLANARSTVERFRNHPSIAVWCGRNEGVPSPALNIGLDHLLAEQDGTRYYSADSNKINLHDSGPYLYQEPSKYFTTLSLGFAVELGLPSPPTLETLQTYLAPEDQWPISDAWAYHDWHQGGNGDTAPFMAALTEQFGPPTNLADFDRKAQMLNYEAHRAAFEGFNAHLWAPNSGRMLWMTQPAWPSMQWQIFSHDYDTHASFYGVKKAGEPVHVQMNLPAHDVAVVNNTLAPLNGLQVSAKVMDLASHTLLEKRESLTAAANSTTPAMPLELESVLQRSGVVLVRLTLTSAEGAALSDNTYLVPAGSSAMRKLNDLPQVALLSTVVPEEKNAAGEQRVRVTLRNDGAVAAVMTKLTLTDTDGTRILPAYYSDNYVTLLPGETRPVEISFPAQSRPVHVHLRGWNVKESDTAARP